MTPYVSIMKLRFMLLLQYRMAAVAAMSTQFLFGLVRVMIFAGFFASTTAAQPMTYAQTITYIWLGQALLGILPWNGDPEVQAMVRSGGVAYELCRPLSLYNHWYFRAISQRTAPTLMRSVPLFLVTLLVMPAEYRMGLPVGMAAAGAWALATVGAVLLSAAMTNLFNISMLWTISGEGVLRLLPALVLIASGMIIPLPFMPDWSQRLLALLPFSGLVDTPFRFYTGLIPASQLAGRLGLQLGWTVALVLLGKWLLVRGMRRVVVQGG